MQQRDPNGKFLKGQFIPWTKGLSLDDPKLKRAAEKIRTSKLGKKRPAWVVEKIRNSRKGWVPSPEIRVKFGLLRKKEWESPEIRKKRTHIPTEDSIQKQRASFQIYATTPRAKANFIKAGKASYTKSGNLVQFHHKRPTQPEKEFMRINESHALGFVYNGDFGAKVIIDGKIPDFVKESSKSIVEIFSAYYHSPLFNPRIRYHQTEQGTIEHYKRQGYRCLVIWQIKGKRLQMSDEEIISEIKKMEALSCRNI